eukprot:2105634-Rhodomonas_salina.1
MRKRNREQQRERAGEKRKRERKQEKEDENEKEKEREQKGKAQPGGGCCHDELRSEVSVILARRHAHALLLLRQCRHHRRLPTRRRHNVNVAIGI